VLFSVNGLDVLISAIEREQSLTKDEVGEIMCCTPLSMEVWLKLKKMDRKIKKYYWENVRAFRLSNADTLDMEYYIEKLLYYKRPFSVINIISFTNYDNSQTIMSTLSKYLELQDHIENNGLSAKSIHLHKILALFEKLYNDFNVEDMDIARLEVAYMPYFQFDINPKGLMRCFTKMPELYIEFISMAYKPDNDSGLNSVTEKAEHVVRSAHDAIERFHEIPGCNGELIDENFFGEWIHRAERIASELGYKTAFEICLGRLLSYSPLGNDGIFPHEIVRKYFETNLSDTMKKNFIIEKMKQRGVQEVTWGDNENRIAQKYKTDGSSIRITYPKTASILDKLSECYLDESRRGQLMEYGDFYT